VNVNDENGVFRAIMLDKFKYYMSKKNPQGWAYIFAWAKQTNAAKEENPFLSNR
jgi:hypothetical protein